MGGVCLFGAILQGATGYTVQAPVLDHVLDRETGSLHRVDGFVGASGIGDALPLDFVVVRAFVSPNQDYAIVADDGGGFWAVDLLARPPVATALEGALEGADGALISPAGTRAALYSLSRGEIQPLSDPRGNPSLGETLQLTGAAGEWTALAISDRGTLLAAASLGGKGALYMRNPGGEWMRIAAVGRAADLAFLSDSDDVVVADAGRGEVLLVRDVVVRRQSFVLASERDELGSPFAVGATAGGTHVVAAVAGGVASIPLLGGSPQFIECGCAPTSLVPLAGGRSFRLTDDIAAPLQVVEVGAAPRLLFVPALATAEPLALTQ